MGNYLIPAKFVRSDDKYVYLNCMTDVENKYVEEKRFPLSNFGDMSFYLGKSIFVKVRGEFNHKVHSFKEDKGNLIDRYFKDGSDNILDNTIFE